MLFRKADLEIEKTRIETNSKGQQGYDDYKLKAREGFVSGSSPLPHSPLQRLRFHLLELK